MIKECRICFEDDSDEQLIKPCLCNGTTKWIHKSCLQRWRQQNFENDKYNKCEICKFSYVLKRSRPLEIYFFNTGKKTYCCNLLLSTFGTYCVGNFICAIDTLNKFSIVMPISSNYIKNIILHNYIFRFGFYQGYLVFWLNAGFLLVTNILIYQNVENKKLYFKKAWLSMGLMHFYFFNFLILLFLTNMGHTPFLFQLWSPLLNSLQLHFYSVYLINHNETVKYINKENKEEILSVYENPTHNDLFVEIPIHDEYHNMSDT